MVSDVPSIRSVMTPFPHSIDAEAALAKAQALMEDLGIRHLPVTNSGKLVGIVTDRDLKLSLDPIVNVPPMRRVRDIMIADPYVVEPDERLDRVLLTMADRRIGCALVAEEGRLTGIFTTTDASRMLGQHLRTPRSRRRRSRT